MALVFFSKFCELSNHFPSTFMIQNTTFYNMEHYLAVKKAEMSQQEYFIQKTLNLQDPVEAKSVLHSLRKDHKQDWERDRYAITMAGLRAKFSQNKKLSSYLCNTGDLQLGEASKNPYWGIGMTLEDQHVTNTEKWNPDGNLLGKLLMKVREEIQLKPDGKNK